MKKFSETKIILGVNYQIEKDIYEFHIRYLEIRQLGSLNLKIKKEGLSSHGLPKRSPTLVLTMPNVA